MMNGKIVCDGDDDLVFDRQDSVDDETMATSSATDAASISRSNSKRKKPRISRLRLLCLHGRKSNMDISKRQMARLGLDQDFDSITYLQGPYVDTALLSSDDDGVPLYYSWVESRSSSETKKEKESTATSSSSSGMQLMQTNLDKHSLLTSLYKIIQHVRTHGPYDAVYGFSQGAALATVLSSRVLRLKVLDYFGDELADGGHNNRDVILSKENIASLNPNGKSLPFLTLPALPFPTSRDDRDHKAQPPQPQRPLQRERRLSGACVVDNDLFADAMSVMESECETENENDEEKFDADFQVRFPPQAPTAQAPPDASCPLDLWNFVFAACAANRAIWEEAASLLRPDVVNENSQRWDPDDDVPLVDLPSVHYIGLEDELFKSQSEEYLMRYSSEHALNFYLDDGHEIPELLVDSTADNSMIDPYQEARNWFHRAYQHQISFTKSQHQAFVLMQASSITAKMQDEVQYLLLDDVIHKKYGTGTPGLHGQYFINHSTTNATSMNLIQMLKRVPGDSVAMQSSSANEASSLTYGALVEFIEGTGNLRHIGIQEGDRVAYVAPPGTLSAVTFLTITSQTTSVPLDPGYSLNDVALALDQIQPTVVVVVSAANDYDHDSSNYDALIEPASRLYNTNRAVQQAADERGIPVAHATATEGTCGLFKFKELRSTSRKIKESAYAAAGRRDLASTRHMATNKRHLAYKSKRHFHQEGQPAVVSSPLPMRPFVTHARPLLQGTLTASFNHVESEHDHVSQSSLVWNHKKDAAAVAGGGQPAPYSPYSPSLSLSPMPSKKSVRHRVLFSQSTLGQGQGAVKGEGVPTPTSAYSPATKKSFLSRLSHYVNQSPNSYNEHNENVSTEPEQAAAICTSPVSFYSQMKSARHAFLDHPLFAITNTSFRSIDTGNNTNTGTSPPASLTPSGKLKMKQSMRLRFAQQGGTGKKGSLRKLVGGHHYAQQFLPLVNAPDQEALILRTSGTTSAPKIVPLHMHALVSNAQAIAASLALTHEDVALNAMPLFHIGGIAANLLSTLAAGGTVIMMPMFDVQEFCDILQNGRGGSGHNKASTRGSISLRSLDRRNHHHQQQHQNQQPQKQHFQPTWYSTVPTMHSAIRNFVKSEMRIMTVGGDEKGRIKDDDVEPDSAASQSQSALHAAPFTHSLRFIRTGAAAMSLELAQEMQHVFGVPVVPTYSMTELMPISQPPSVDYPMIAQKPNSVGQPLVASMAIMGPDLKPLSYQDEKGEICISGPNVFDQYEANPKANSSAFFVYGGVTWFRTGDLGQLDREGFLYITGRSKDMIKRGGDQVSPVEVEDILDTHPVIHKAVVFAVPDPLWGERPGAAIALEEDFAVGVQTAAEQAKLKKELRAYFAVHDKLVAPKYPEEIVFVTMEELPKTKSGKYIRIGLSEKLGVTARLEAKREARKPPVKMHGAANGMRFILALAVCYVHIGSMDASDWRSTGEKDSTSTGTSHSWTSSRGWCIHTPLFFLLGGFFIASGTGSEIKTLKDFKRFYSMRILALHPMYLLSVAVCTLNYVIRCQPSNYIQEFDRTRMPLEGQYFVCQATPLEMSYGGTLSASIATYIVGLQAWPTVIPTSWFLSSYSWFSSVFYFCILVFPWCHRAFFRVRRDIFALWKWTALWLVLHFAYMGAAALYFGIEDDNLAAKNYFTLAAYVFPIGWLPSFVFGVAMFFMFQHYSVGRTQGNKKMWGYLTDAMSFLFLAFWLFYGLGDKCIPDFVDTSMDKRQWFAYVSRLLVPITAFWVWGVAIGRGLTARLFSSRIMVDYLAPASYNMFLFHQPLSEWYFLATRGTWWAYPKPDYWFSPRPTPVHFWEFPIVMVLIICVCLILERYVNEPLIGLCGKFGQCVVRVFCCCYHPSDSRNKDNNDQDIMHGSHTNTELVTVQQVIKGMTQYEVNEDTELVEAGINSMMSAILLNRLNGKLAINVMANATTNANAHNNKKPNKLRLSLADLRGVYTVGALASVIQAKTKTIEVSASGKSGEKLTLETSGGSSINEQDDNDPGEEDDDELLLRQV
jgi:acyl-CoA synthetase (AMP-forming)/AMP-acid ligase II